MVARAAPSTARERHVIVMDAALLSPLRGGCVGEGGCKAFFEHIYCIDHIVPASDDVAAHIRLDAEPLKRLSAPLEEPDKQARPLLERNAGHL